MKKFEFSLASVRRWRAMELAREQAKYQSLLAACARIRERISQLHDADWERRQQLAQSISLDGSEFTHEHLYRELVAIESQKLAQQQRRLEQEAAVQASKTAEARRAAELIEKIREKEFAAWKAEFERELQAVAEEAHASRLARERRS